MSIEDKKLFEAALKAEGFADDMYFVPSPEGIGGEYCHDFTQCRWEGWKLARSQSQPAPQWIAVTERLPELNTKVLLYWEKTGHAEDGIIYKEGALHFHALFDGESLNDFPTHWQPLPPAPAQQGGEHE